VTGRGVSVRRRGTTATGDLIVQVQVQVPSNPTPAERAAIEALAAATTVNPRTGGAMHQPTTPPTETTDETPHTDADDVASDEGSPTD